MRTGMVLLELVLVVVITAMLAAFAIPHLSAWTDTHAARAESIQLVAAIDATRGAAVRLGTTATLTISDTSYRVTAMVGTDTVLTWHASGPLGRHVRVTGAGAPINFGPAGLAVGAANRTLTITSGTVSRTVVMSRLGRVVE